MVANRRDTGNLLVVSLVYTIEERTIVCVSINKPGRANRRVLQWPQYKSALKLLFWTVFFRNGHTDGQTLLCEDLSKMAVSMRPSVRVTITRLLELLDLTNK